MTWRVRFRWPGDPIIFVRDFESFLDAWRFRRQQRRLGWEATIS